MFGFGNASKSNQLVVPILPKTNPDQTSTTIVDPLTINPLTLPVVTVLGPGQSAQTPNPVPVPVGQIAATFRTGTNLVSMESATYDQYNQSTGPGTNLYPIYDTNLLNYLQIKGVANVRFLFSWEAMQSNLGGTVPSSGTNYQKYWNNYITTLNALLARDIKVMCEPWQYSPNTQDTNICYRGAKFTQANFQDFWGKFVTSINGATNNNQNVSFGLINEPHQGAITGGDTVANWYSYAQAAINGIRNTGNINTIYIPGWSYTDCASFVSNGSAAQHLLLTDTANNLGVTVHNYNGQLYGTNTSTTALRDAMASLMTWARANSITRINIGEVAIDNGNPSGSGSVATSQWADWQAFCITNKDIITGWNWWAVSANAWWNTADSSAGSHWSLTNGTTAQSASTPVSPYNSWAGGIPFSLNDSIAKNWICVPPSYDSSHNTPMKCFIYLHGGTGRSSDDIYTISPSNAGGSQDWISLCPEGTGTTEGGYWDTSVANGVTTVNRIITALTYIKTRFNIDPARVFIGGYSSGGDLAYDTIFRHSLLFAGVITQNTNPFRDNSFNNSSSAAFAANSAGWKFNVAHEYHTSDTTYPKSTTLSAFTTMTNAGYSINLTEKPGGHSDGNTYSDLLAFYPVWLASNWTCPAAASSGTGIKDSSYMDLIGSSLGRF